MAAEVYGCDKAKEKRAAHSSKLFVFLQMVHLPRALPRNANPWVTARGANVTGHENEDKQVKENGTAASWHHLKIKTILSLSPCEAPFMC